MKAQLYVKGMRDPIELESDEAKAAEALIADTKLPPETAFYIQGVWSGRKSDMKFVVFPKKEGSYESKKYDVETMSAEEVKIFSKEIEQDIKKSGELFSKSYHWDLCYLARHSAINLRTIKAKGAGEAVVPDWGILDLEKYDECNAKFEAFNLYHSRKEYAQKMATDKLEKEKLVKQKTV